MTIKNKLLNLIDKHSINKRLDNESQVVQEIFSTLFVDELLKEFSLKEKKKKLKLEDEGLKSVRIMCKEWLDKPNNNRYFGGYVIVNENMASEKRFSIPFTLGYGNHYKQKAIEVLKENKVNLPIEGIALWKLKNYGIKTSSILIKGASKRETRNITDISVNYE